MANRRRSRRVGARPPRRTRLAHFRADGTAKTRFETRDDAERAALQARLDHGSDMASYSCDMCGGWHLGGSDESR